jgi:hypothetical protein
MAKISSRDTNVAVIIMAAQTGVCGATIDDDSPRWDRPQSSVHA